MRSSTKDLEEISVCAQQGKPEIPSLEFINTEIRPIRHGRNSIIQSRMHPKCQSVSLKIIRREPIDIPSINLIPNFGRNFTPGIPIKMGSRLRRGTFWVWSHRDTRRSARPTWPASSRVDHYWRWSRRIKVRVPRRGRRWWDRRGSVIRRHLVRWDWWGQLIMPATVM